MATGMNMIQHPVVVMVLGSRKIFYAKLCEERLIDQLKHFVPEQPPTEPGGACCGNIVWK